jgi:ribonuclease G
LPREILIESVGGETRIALLEDDQLSEAYIERPGSKRLTGDIYKGRVNKVLPGMQSAFVDIGLERDAFLYVEDLLGPGEALGDIEGIDPEPTPATAPPENTARAPIEQLLTVGQDLIVQITREPMARKGARITTQTALAGRFLVYLPGVEHVGVSRRIEDVIERERLKSTIVGILSELALKGGGIVRTAGEARTIEEFRADARYLAGQWEEIARLAGARPAPAVLHREPGVVARVLRDVFHTDVARVIVDSPDVFGEVVETVGRMQSDLVSRIRLHAGTTSLFGEHGIQRQLDRALRPRVWLKSGGSIVINQTEALVAIDVNTGKYVGKRRLEETILRTNLEAVEEIVRQVRLRDAAGIIVIDFIDMEELASRTQVLEALRHELGKDRSRSRVLQISEFGLVEITRQRTKRSLERLLCRPCPSCYGSGRLKSLETIYYEVLRAARICLAGAAGSAVRVRVHPEVAAYLEEEREALSGSLGLAGAARVAIEADETLGRERYEVAPA